MADRTGFDRQLQRIGGVFADMREASQPIRRMMAEAAEKSTLPDGETLAAEDARLMAEMRLRRAAEAELAHLVSELAADIAYRKAEFDNRERPTRSDRLIGILSGAAMRRRIETRSASPASLPHLEELLRRGDAIAGLLDGERGRLLAERRESETDLATVVDHRPETVKALRGEKDEAMSGIDATARIERVTSVFERFVEDINRRVGACNVLLHKLLADIEDLLILYQVVFDVSRVNTSVLFPPESFANLSAEIDRFSRGMLTIRGLDGRRERADRAFFETFAAEAPATAEGEAAMPAKRGRRLSTISGFRLSRS